MSHDPLFVPLEFGTLRLANRVVMAPMTRNYSPEGVPAGFMTDYYVRRAAVGLIVSEGIGVDHPAALGSDGLDGGAIPNLHDPAAAARWREIVDAVHAAGGVIFPQLWHQGVLRRPGTGPHPQAPSARPSGVFGPTNRSPFFTPEFRAEVEPPSAPLSEREVEDIIGGFARSAKAAQACGFDGIAIHGAHGYLPDAFLWSETNRRTDRFGGPTLAQRAAFAVELIKAVRAAAPGLPLMYRFSQWKLHDYDARHAGTPDELAEFLEPMAAAGVDIFDASTRRFADPAFAGSPLSLAGWAKKITGRPAMAVGGVSLARDLQDSLVDGSAASDNLAEVRKRLGEGEFDLIGVGRSLLANPDWIERARSGQGFAGYDREVHATKI